MSDLARPLAEAAVRLFAQHCSVELVNRAETPHPESSRRTPGSSSLGEAWIPAYAGMTQGEWPQALWLALEDLGPAQLLIPEERGGAGGDWLDACTLLECAGEYNVPLPIAETMLAAWLLDLAGEAVPAGPLSFACTGVDLAPASGAGATGRMSLRLQLRNVPWAAACTHLVIAAPHGDGVALLSLPRAAFTVTPGRALSGEPRDEVSIADLDVTRAGVALRRIETLSYLECLSRAALLRAALMAGACRRVLALTLAYTNERVQFGRAIGQFQAVQHQLAQLAEEAAAARVAVHAAAATTQARWCSAADAAAKVRAGEAAGLAVRIAHQLHGAIGITIEHALHQSTRRLLTWRDEHGAEAWWARELVAQFRRHGEGGSAGAWSTLVAATTR